MRSVVANWPSTDVARQFLFFIQVLEEALSPDSWDSRRVYALDTVSRLREGLEVLSDIDAGRMNQAALTAVLEEIRWSIQEDPLIASAYKNHVLSLMQHNKSDVISRNELQRVWKFLHDTWNPTYRTLAETKLSELIINAGEKNRILLRRVALIWACRLIDAGYQPEAIIEAINAQFVEVKRKVIRTNTISTFFRTFQNEGRKFSILFKTSASFGLLIKNDRQFKKIQNPGLQIPRFVLRQHSSFIPVHLGKKSRETLFEYEISSHDHFGAIEKLRVKLGLHQALLLSMPTRIVATTDPTVIIRTKRGTTSQSMNLPLKSLNIQRPHSERAVRVSFRRNLRIIDNSFDDDSKIRLTRSLEASKLARQSAAVDIQIVSLWSAIELLLTEPPISHPRIPHYSDLLVPCICVNYVRRHVTTLRSELQRNFKTHITNILGDDDLAQSKKNITGPDLDIGLAAILALKSEKRDKAQKALLKACSAHPLACHRIWYLHEILTKPEKAWKLIKNHEQRVKWQIQRIYRARNNLVHSGRKADHYSTLAFNLDDYYRSVFGNLLRFARKHTGGELSVDSAVNTIGIKYELMKLTFSSDLKGALDENRLLSLVSGAV